MKYHIPLLQTFSPPCNDWQAEQARSPASRRSRPDPELRLSQHDLTYDDLVRIVELVKSSEQFSEFRLKVGDVEIELRRRRGQTASPPMSEPAMPSVPARETAEPPNDDAGSRDEPPRVTPSWSAASSVVRAPMMGTYYVAPEPGAPPFVTIGQCVEPDTTVCIIEVMKLMNSIPARARGVVSQVLVDDGAPVEAGTPLIVVDPEGSAP
jgi:acetyl-CoA carboxylase biotin carboxyl carrier protein